MNVLDILEPYKVPSFRLCSFSNTQISETSSLFRVSTKSILSGASAYLLFGPQIAICTILVNLILSSLTKDVNNQNWFSKNSLLETIKDRVSTFDLLAVTRHQIFFTFVEIFSKAPYAFSAASWALLEAHQKGKKSFVSFFSYMTLGGPFVEEIFFRGFLQEKIRDIQLLLFKGQEDSSLHKTIRVALQAFVFGALHYHPIQGAYNFLVIPLLFWLGYIFGANKEGGGSLWDTVVDHSLHNTTVAIRILIASRYWRLLPY